MDIRLANEKDILALVEIHNLSFKQNWSQKSLIKSLFNNGALSFVAENDGMISTFIIVQILVDEAEIITIATLPNFRKQGLAGKLLNEACLNLKEKSVNKLFLEVSENNHAAKTLYLSNGFKISGQRKNYYQDGSDAVIMQRIL